MAEFSVTGESSAQKQQLATIYRTLPTGDQPRSCSDLLSELHPPSRLDTHALNFEPMDGRDVYNITAPFLLNGKVLLIGRVEKRDTEISEIVVFEQAHGDK